MRLKNFKIQDIPATPHIARVLQRDLILRRKIKSIRKRRTEFIEGANFENLKRGVAGSSS